MILETQRLYLRKLTQDDFVSLCKILQDAEVMVAYEGPFSDQEVQIWLDNQLNRYRDNFGLLAVILKENNELIGQCGLTIQKYKQREVIEIGYLFNRNYWHKGYATEAAIACKEHAFIYTHEVFSIIRDSNLASQRVAIRNGMRKIDEFTKHYKGVDMLHYVYQIKRD